MSKEMEPILIAFVKHNRIHFSTNIFRDIVSKVGSRPLSVVSINYSKGEDKEQVFNTCLKYLNTLDVNGNKEIGWKSKSDADSKGIYLWPEPTIIRKSCQEVGVVLMENNGFFDPKTVTREDMMLFALSCVLSSTLIYSIESHFSTEMQEFLQLFGKYGRGGIGSELNDSFLNLVLLVNNWKSTVRYPFGYHDSSTCPPNGKKFFNYRNERLDTKLSPDKNLEEIVALKNKSFVDSFQKIAFCLMPGKNSQMVDENSNIPKFADIWYKIVVRLIHPSYIAIKRLSHQKLNGNQLIQLFEEMSSLMAEADNQNQTEEDFQEMVKNVNKGIVEQIIHKKENNGVQSELDIQISQLIGFSLDELTNAVHSVIGTK